MAQAYGAALAISMCKHGSDILKMRGEKNKTMFGFWVQQLVFLKLKLTGFCLD